VTKEEAVPKKIDTIKDPYIMRKLAKAELEKHKHADRAELQRLAAEDRRRSAAARASQN
jgi:hypothetical protein